MKQRQWFSFTREKITSAQFGKIAETNGLYHFQFLISFINLSRQAGGIKEQKGPFLAKFLQYVKKFTK